MNRSSTTTIICRNVIGVVLLATLLLAGGCATKGRPTPLDAAGKPVAVDFYGRVVRVNDADRYVVLECTFLPTAGEEITLFRDHEKRVRSRVRVGTVASMHWVAAEILEGYPQPGDWFIGR